MKTAAELYLIEEEEDKYWLGESNYQPMLDEFGTIALQVDDDDYQGDSRVLYCDGERWGWLQFGWGSCSGCDALQACESIEEIQTLMDGLYTDIKWFSSTEEALQFFIDHDWKGDYSWHASEQQEFVTKVVALLKEV